MAVTLCRFVPEQMKRACCWWRYKGDDRKGEVGKCLFLHFSYALPF